MIIMNLSQARQTLSNQDNVIELDWSGNLVFVGDTHGDLSASQTVILKFSDSDTVIVFLGDYVDRGPRSKENIDFLLQKKIENPDRIFLLQGNHEGYRFQQFSPVNFWENLTREQSNKYQSLLAKLPLALSWDGLLALHGGLPNVERLSQINDLQGGKDNWRKITWGDFREQQGYTMGSGLGRPQLGRDYFNTIMNKLDKQVLIRAHQPNVPVKMFDDRCITIFTSSAYGTTKRIAKVTAPVSDGNDVSIVPLSNGQ